MSNSDNENTQAYFVDTYSIPEILPSSDLTIRAGQTDLEIKYTLLGLNRNDPDLATLIYRAKLIDYMKRHHFGDDWNALLTPRQQEVMLEGRQCADRRKYEKRKGAPVRSYRRNLNLTDDEKRAEDAERKRRDRARDGGPSKRKPDLAAMSAQERDEHKKRKARERKQRQRDKQRLAASMTEAELQAHEEALEREEQAKLQAIIATLGK